MKKEKISLLHSLLIILGSLLFTASVFMVSFRYYQHVADMRKTDGNYNIAAVIQTGYEKEPLATSYLIELMDLSLDRPTNLYAVDERLLQERLLNSPLIKSAAVHKAIPNILYIDYEARKPIAYLKDFSNTLISDDGILLPFKPFFSPKNFPGVYLGALIDRESIYGAKIPDDSVRLILDFIRYTQDFFGKSGESIRFIDFSSAKHPNKERSEIVLFIEGRRSAFDFQCLIRLRAHSYQESFALYSSIMKKEEKRIEKILKGKAKEWHLIIDLRTPKMALVTP